MGAGKQPSAQSRGQAGQRKGALAWEADLSSNEEVRAWMCVGWFGQG